jgi:hypothetical protein
VLLGASNLTLAFPLVIEALRHRALGPVEVLAALGHGRSYGQPSRVFFRELPGIEDCGLWPDLARAQPADTQAVVCDLGNDIVYGFEVARIAAWVATCLGRLEAARARITLVRMPLTVVDGIGSFRFRLARSVLFPGRRIDLATLRERVHALDREIVALAHRHGASMVEPPASWYGLDPIHVRPGHRREAWGTILEAGAPRNGRIRSESLARADRLALRKARPQWRRHFGREQRCTQPAAELLDGTTISLY